MIEKLMELIDAMIPMAKEVTKYCQRANAGGVVKITPEIAARLETTAAKKTRKKKTQPAEEPAAPASNDMTEIESTKEMYAVTQRFVKANGDEGKQQAIGIINSEFKVAKLGDLVHSQRIQYITEIEALIAA